jgi:hypothetical protein
MRILQAMRCFTAILGVSQTLRNIKADLASCFYSLMTPTLDHLASPWRNF